MSDKCELEITSVDPQTHFGTWECTVESLGGVKASSKIILKKSQPALVDFEYFGTVQVEMGSKTVLPLTCKATPKDYGIVFDSPPGEMTFRLDYKNIKDVTDWEKVNI